MLENPWVARVLSVQPVGQRLRGSVLLLFLRRPSGAWLDVDVEMPVDDSNNDKPSKKRKTPHRTVSVTADMFAEKIDEAKVVQALAFLKAERAKATKNKLDEAFAIGDHLYAEFFERSPLAYTHKGRNSPSLRALMENPEFEGLGLSRSTIANYITVTIQRDRFEFHISKGKLAPTVRSLGFTHRVRLTPCKKVTDEMRIAVQAVDEGLSPGAVQELVKRANAGKAAVAAARSPESEVVRGVKHIYKDVTEVAGLDLDAASDEDLAALKFFGVRSAKALNELAAYAKGELASRPGARAPTAMDAFGAETPDELDELMQATTGEDLGLGPALRRDTTKIIQGLGAEILTNLEYADPQAANGWLVTFVAAAAAKLGAAGDLRERLWSKPDKNLTKSQPPSRGRRAWYVVFGRDVAVPEEPGSVFNVLDTRLKENKCIVEAIDEDEAVAQFRQRADGLDADVGDPAREIGADRFGRTVGAVKVSVAMYLRRPLSERLPTLDEYVNRAPVTPNPRR